MRLQITWTDLDTQQVRSPILEPPIAFGREFGEMPSTFKGQPVQRMVLKSEQVLPFHALLIEKAGQLMILGRQGGAGVRVNGTASETQPVNSGDLITIGPFEVEVTALPAEESLPSSCSTASSAGFGADGRCDREVGFLFKHRCGRTTSEGCPDCRNGQIEPGQDLYQADYAYYPNYGNYGHGYWGHSYYHNRHHYYYDPHSRQVDFNESDAASFEQVDDQDYETDLDAS